MIATLAVYLVALLALLLAGAALQALLAPSGRWIDYSTPVLGACLLVALLYPLSHLGPMRVVGPAALGGLLALLVAVTALRLARARGREGPRAALAAAFRPARLDLLVAGAGVVGGLLVLIPVLALGLPTILAIDNNDAWYYAGVVDWLSHHAAGTSYPAPDPGDPLLEAGMRMMDLNSLPYGFELIAASVRGVLDRESYQVLGAMGAVAVPLATAGWARLGEALGVRRALLLTAGALVASSSPLLVLALAQDNLTHAAGLALVPFALGATVLLLRAPDLPRLVVAALAAGAVIGVYPSLAPWLVVMALVAALLLGGPLPERLRGPRILASAPAPVRGLAVLVVLGAAAAILDPIALARAIDFTRVAAEATGQGPWSSYPAGTNLTFLSGALPLLFLPVGTLEVLGALGVVLALALAVGLSRSRSPARLAAPALCAAALAATAIVFSRYARNDYNYGLYKSLMSGGALAAGCLALALALRATTRRTTAIALGGLAICAAVWISSSVTLLRDVSSGLAGLRRDDVELIRTLRTLPAGTTVLVDGAESGFQAASFDTFSLRMATAYAVATTPGLHGIGLRSTQSLISAGPLPEFRPDRPWDYVLRSRDSPVGTTRREVWRDGPYLLERAPAVDLTPYGTGWHLPEFDAAGAFQWISGPVELVVSNRGAGVERVRLSLTAESPGARRTARLRVEGGGGRGYPLAPDAPRDLALDLTVPARSLRTVRLDATPGARPGPGADVRRLLLRLRRVTVAPLRVRLPAATG